MRLHDAADGKVLFERNVDGWKPGNVAWIDGGRWLAVSPGADDHDHLLRLFRTEGFDGPTLPANQDCPVAWLEKERTLVVPCSGRLDSWSLADNGTIQRTRCMAVQDGGNVAFDLPRNRFYSLAGGALWAADISTGGPLWTVVPVNDRSARIDSEGILTPAEPDNEKDFFYYVEQPGRSAAIYTPAEFRKLPGTANASARPGLSENR